MNKPVYSALVRGDDDGLHVRHFDTPEAAAEASQKRELPTGRKSGWTIRQLAERMGVHPQTVKARIRDQVIPAVCYGPRSWRIPAEAARHVLANGLGRPRR